MVRVSPTTSVPSEQGNAVMQSPALETNTRPVGVGSVTVTLLAATGPALATTMVNTTCSPGAVAAGPVLLMLRAGTSTGVITSSSSVIGVGVGVVGVGGGVPAAIAVLSTPPSSTSVGVTV